MPFKICYDLVLPHVHSNSGNPAIYSVFLLAHMCSQVWSLCKGLRPPQKATANQNEERHNPLGLKAYAPTAWL